jgi:hypothetical protein
MDCIQGLWPRRITTNSQEHFGQLRSIRYLIILVLLATHMPGNRLLILGQIQTKCRFYAQLLLVKPNCLCVSVTGWTKPDNFVQRAGKVSSVGIAEHRFRLAF